MSPRVFKDRSPDAVTTALRRMWFGLGMALRDARLRRKWSVRELAENAAVSPVVVYRLEGGARSSLEAASRLAAALGLRLDLTLSDPRRPAAKPSLSVDPVHSAMGEFEMARFRAVGVKSGVDEPYQHFQFAGRADVIAWDLAKAALLHIENRTRFPDFQDMAGSYNAKRAYLAASLGERLGVRRWASQTHVIVGLWSSEVIHPLRLRPESFRSLCPDPADAFEAWWSGDAPMTGNSSILILLDPLAHSRQRAYIALGDALGGGRPRHRGYSDVATKLLVRSGVSR